MNAITLRKSRVASHGFTLIEAMVVVALVAIVSAIAAPNMQTMIGSMNSRAVAFDLINDLTYARSEAIKRNQTASIVPVGGDWTQGWQVSAGGQALRSRSALASSLGVSGAAATGVTFQPNGRIVNDTTTANLTWSISSSITGVQSRCVVISPTGAARSKNGSCS